ncbi:MAG: ABC transporter permease [Oscillospiraceae bacterium]|nr:ABC transporter permease [Oscillospiraceae bacterium]
MVGGFDFTNFFFMAVIAATPLLFATLGEILTEKSGSLNLGVEGMMFMGAAAGIAASYFYETAAGSGASGIVSALLAVLIGFLAGAFGGFIYSLLTVTLRANQNVTGLALTIFGIGAGNLIGELLGIRAGGFTTVSDSTKSVFSGISIPFLSDIPVIGRLFFSYNFMVYLAVATAVLLIVLLNKTRVGLNLRGVGENPATADAVGINVTKYKYIAASVGGGICGLGGVYISMATVGGNAGTWIDNCIAGRGWIAVALVIFAAWRPSRAIIGALLFGGLSALWLYFDPWLQTFLPNASIPQQIYNVLPFIATILVLIFTSIRQSKELSQPKACGTNYFREER